MTIYCVACGFDTESSATVCKSCALIHGVSESWTPVTCGDSVCYYSANGELNLDGECEHSALFDSVIRPEYRF